MATGEMPYTLPIVANEMFKGLNSYPLLAIPLFILAGELMNESRITKRIIAFANVLVGGFRAGLAHVNIWASVMFAGLSGSAVADTSTIGRVLIPEMEKHGYDRSFAVGNALTLGAFVYRRIDLTNLPRIFLDAMRDSAAIVVIIAAVAAANWLLTYNRIPNMLTGWVVGNVDSKTAFLLAVIALLLVVGLSFGLDPVHFGILVIFNLMIGPSPRRSGRVSLWRKASPRSEWQD